MAWLTKFIILLIEREKGKEEYFENADEKLMHFPHCLPGYSHLPLENNN